MVSRSRSGCRSATRVSLGETDESGERDGDGEEDVYSSFLVLLSCQCPCSYVICLAGRGLWFGVETTEASCGWAVVEVTKGLLVADGVEVFVANEDIALSVVGAPMIIDFALVYAASRGGCGVEGLAAGRVQRWKQCDGFLYQVVLLRWSSIVFKVWLFEGYWKGDPLTLGGGFAWEVWCLCADGVSAQPLSGCRGDV
ncbi:hypothetical protein SUGI_0618600 [Cryptomeria japonica]|nr:hypothetical protein SUGI_0618600 [Cryptomeria japonica]